jgi:F0F1-type ATP synthase assembly protein I
MTAKDLKGAYKDLGKDVAECEKKVADGRPKVDEMNTEAEGYFAAWKASAEAISDPDLRKRSEERLADAKARFDKIASAKFNTRANTVFTKADGVTKMYEEYIASMKP